MEQLKRLLSENKLKEVLEELYDITTDKGSHHTAIALQAQLQELEISNNKGLLSTEEKRLAYANLVDKTLLLIDKINEEGKNHTEFLSIDNEKLESIIRKALHENGQRRGGSRVTSAEINTIEHSGTKIWVEGSYKAVNYILFSYGGEFKGMLYSDKGSIKIEKLAFRNFVDRDWTSILKSVIEDLNA